MPNSIQRLASAPALSHGHQPNKSIDIKARLGRKEKADKQKQQKTRNRTEGHGEEARYLAEHVSQSLDLVGDHLLGVWHIGNDMPSPLVLSKQSLELLD